MVVGTIHLRRVLLGSENVHHIDKSADAVSIIVSHADENDWNARSHANCVLNIEVLYHTEVSFVSTERKGLPTASIPASERVWGFTPPSRVCSVKVVLGSMSLLSCLRNRPRSASCPCVSLHSMS